MVQFLEAVHTSSGNSLVTGKLGLEANYGHVDYYPNGGRDQPGCSCEFPTAKIPKDLRRIEMGPGHVEIN